MAMNNKESNAMVLTSWTSLQVETLTIEVRTRIEAVKGDGDGNAARDGSGRVFRVPSHTERVFVHTDSLDK